MSAEKQKHKPKEKFFIIWLDVQISDNLSLGFFLLFWMTELLDSREFCLIIIQMIVNPNRDDPGAYVLSRHYKAKRYYG